MNAWFDATTAGEPLSLYGRLGVGKSWLFRRFAHGRDAVLLVAAKSSEGAQLRGFERKLEPLLGVRPSIGSVAELFRVLLGAGRGRKFLAVIDEFPWLLPGTEVLDTEMPSSIAAVLEDERDGSDTRLLLCGSYVQQMEALMGERGPLHGRLSPMQLRPMPFEQGALFMPTLSPIDQLERYAIAGGMPRHLSELGRGQLRETIAQRVLDRDGPLWDEPRVVREQELRDSRNYFAVAAALAHGPVNVGEITNKAALPSKTVSKYLNTLAGLRIVSRALPINAPPSARNGRRTLDDPFFRFSFRFVFPLQDELENGLAATDLFDAEVAGNALADHVAPEFETWCRAWVRATYGARATTVGPWWGNALNELRRTGVRSSEEVDIVGMKSGKATLVGEVKWRNSAMDANLIRDFEQSKVPAMKQDGLRFAADFTTLIISKGGYTSRCAPRHASRTGASSYWTCPASAPAGPGQST